jgi:hypothetical protein
MIKGMFVDVNSAPPVAALANPGFALDCSYRLSLSLSVERDHSGEECRHIGGARHDVGVDCDCGQDGQETNQSCPPTARYFRGNPDGYRHGKKKRNEKDRSDGPSPCSGGTVGDVPYVGGPADSLKVAMRRRGLKLLRTISVPSSSTGDERRGLRIACLIHALSVLEFVSGVATNGSCRAVKSMRRKHTAGKQQREERRGRKKLPDADEKLTHSNLGLISGTNCGHKALFFRACSAAIDCAYIACPARFGLACPRAPRGQALVGRGMRPDRSRANMRVSAWTVTILHADEFGALCR